MFFKVAEVDVSMATLGLPDICTSLTSCAVRCLMFPGLCFSCKYNIVTSECVLEKRMHLYTPITLQKDSSLKSIAVRCHRQLWIGLNDLEKEKVFKWMDDGTVLDLNSIFKKQIFHPNEPNDYDNDEDCVEYSLYFASLNDMDCKNKNYCICERSTREPAF
ncbi:CD209 antigen-like protein 2 [Biomphalaria pfeifferi]|uniref:CD209 antigen-like protein 2 n=1 Tax=Biomphalaria pfeifferi TaxID=112525 RepID=A0AAD8B8C1_BIOPF|nr:CD209 antigen-like protein 2 [Biomphalaria pfeifferi]